jgi:hypothetical protein
MEAGSRGRALKPLLTDCGGLLARLSCILAVASIADDLARSSVGAVPTEPPARPGAGTPGDEQLHLGESFRANEVSRTWRLGY